VAMSVDFQRLESVRARQRSQRKRWLSVLSILAGAAVAVALIQLAASVMPAWRDLVPLLSRGAALVEARGVVEARGRVETIERETRTIRISSGFLGLTSVALVVTEDTLIVVGEKEGGFGDIRPGEPVVAAYEVGRGALQAKRVEVVRPAKPSGN
jgi:hypothetical protein